MDQAAVQDAEKGIDNGSIEVWKPLPSPRHTLLPILSQHQLPTGALVVDKEEIRVVYLAPLMPTAKEMYFAKHKELLKGKSNTEVNSEEQEAEQRSNRQLLASLERHLAVVQKPSQQLGSQNQQSSSSVFASPSTDDLQRNNVPVTVESGAASSTDGQLKRMKQRVKLLPISDDDRVSFWETIRGYENMRAYCHQTVVAGGAFTPMGFNMEAAFKRMLLEERHLLWVSTHESRLEGNKMRKVQEDENYERRAIETSSDYRARQRLQKRIREQLICEAQNMQPIVMLSVFTQKMLNTLRMHWSRCRLESNLSRTVRIWKQHRSIKRTNSQAAHLLIEWLQKSVAVKSVGFRAFRGLRIFIRRVKKVQGLWRKKQAVRRLKMLIIEKAWMELEAQYVDAAIEEYESRRLEAEQYESQRKSPKSGSKQKNRKKREVWMRFVPVSVRDQVIVEFLQKVEQEYQEKFRNQEVDFFPQLVQTLRGEHPNRARTYIRVVAMRYALCGRVVDTLLHYPGAVGDDVAGVKPFDVHQAPNDDEVRQVLGSKASHETEEHKKQLALLLQRRRQLRQASPIKDVIAPESHQPLPTPQIQSVVSGLSERAKDAAAALFDSLVDQHFNRFSRRGSRLLLNPSVIEFQDTMKELKQICAEEPNSSFFMILSTHGARVSRGVNEGSYVLFSETRVTSEEELVLTAIHERELAEMIHNIPCKNKFVALELCQTQEPKDKIIDGPETIHHRIHEHFFAQLHKRLVQLCLKALLERGVQLPSNEEITEEAVRTNPQLLNLILMESCDVKSEVPVRSNEERVSNFLLRFRDAFRGAAISPKLNEEEVQQGPRHSLFAKEVVEYVGKAIRDDAAKHNAFLYAEYKSQVRTKYEQAAEFQDITHTPSVLGAEHALDFGLGETPEPPTVSPAPPLFVASTLSSISLKWSFTPPTLSSEFPAVLGYHIQRRGHGRACVDEAGEASIWKRCAAFQVLSYEEAVRNAIVPPTGATIFGLATDTIYCFRVRARTAGGWGPFSNSTKGYRTLSATSTLDQRETIRLAAMSEGANGIAKLMEKHNNSGAIQRYATDVLATMSIKGNSASMQPLAPSDLPVVVLVRDAMLKFKRDMYLQQQGCILFGRLAGSNATWRTALQSVKSPSVLSIVQGITIRTKRDHNSELTRCATWALDQLQSGSIVRQRQRPALNEHEAAMRLQGLYRCRKAREGVRALARSVYAQAVDPASGMAYVFNTRTGATFWELPQFAS